MERLRERKVCGIWNLDVIYTLAPQSEPASLFYPPALVCFAMIRDSWDVTIKKRPRKSLLLEANPLLKVSVP